MSDQLFDVVIIGGGPVGLASAYEAAKTGAKVLILEQNNFFNHAGSSGDLARMFRTMYTEDFMADLAKEALAVWDELERDSGTSLRWMSGLLNFGDKDMGSKTPEGNLLGPIKNLERLNMAYEKLSAKDIEDRYPFRNLPPNYIGLFAPDNGVINVQLLLRTLLGLAKDYDAIAKQHTQVKSIKPWPMEMSIWEVHATGHDEEKVVYRTRKIIIASGAYVNHVLKPSFGISLDLDIWEMVASYFNCNAGPRGTIFPSMWFQFAPEKDYRSQLFYGFPTLPWGPPNLARIAVDAATRRITDPDQRTSNILSPEDIRDTQDFIRDHVPGVDATTPAFTLTCLQTNVFDNMFVLDFIPAEYLHGGRANSIVVFTAGWAMKFVPLLGKALAELALQGKSKYAREEFSITRADPVSGKRIIVEDAAQANAYAKGRYPSSFDSLKQGSGSSIKGRHNTTNIVDAVWR